MQIQNISNQQSFKGNVIMVGKFGEVPEKIIQKSLPKLEKIIEKKPYDLFLEQHKNKGVINVYAQKEKDFKLNRGPVSSVTMNDKEDFYEKCAEYVVKEQDLKLKNQPTFSQKCKKFVDKMLTKFIEAFQDKEEV